MKVNRDIIVQAALRLLDDTGLEDLTLRKLAQALDIQAPTLYWHFKSKDALIDEMATDALGRLLEQRIGQARAGDHPAAVAVGQQGFAQALPEGHRADTSDVPSKQRQP